MNARLPKAAELAELPLIDEAAVLERVTGIIRCAARHEVWFFLLDHERRQSPLLIPVDLPRRPDGDTGAAFARMLSGLLSIDGIAHLVLVYERPGPAQPTRDDLAWLSAFTEAIGLAAVSVLGLYFATEQGVRRWEPHHDADTSDVMMQEWPHEDDDYSHPGGARARGAGNA